MAAESSSSPLDQVAAVREQAGKELSAATSPEALEQFRIRFLGTKGQVKGLMKLLGAMPAAERPALGQAVNALQAELTEAFEGAKQRQAAGDQGGREGIDVTEPGIRPELGNRHPILKTADELAELFGRMGFVVAEGPEVEDEFHNFVALNIPASHPARDPA